MTTEARAYVIRERSYPEPYSNVQRQSFQRFLNVGLAEVFQPYRVIRVSTSVVAPNARLRFVFHYPHYRLRRPLRTVRQCLLQRHSYTTELFMPVTVRSGGRVAAVKTLLWFKVMDLPLMTKSGHFVIRGIARALLNQVVRSPGVHFQFTRGASTYGSYHADFIAQRGSWLRLEAHERSQTIWAKLKYTPRLPLLPLLRCFGLPPAVLSLYLDTFGHPRSKEPFWLNDNLLDGLKTHESIPRVFSRLRLDRVRGRVPSSFVRHVIHAYAEQPTVFALRDFLKLDDRSGNTPTTVRKTNDQLFQFYVETVYGRFLKRRFWNPKTYTLGPVGRWRLNRTLGLRLPASQMALTACDVLFGALHLMRTIAEPQRLSDVDDLQNQIVKPGFELLQSQVVAALAELEKNLRLDMVGPGGPRGSRWLRFWAHSAKSSRPLRLASRLAALGSRPVPAPAATGRPGPGSRADFTRRRRYDRRRFLRGIARHRRRIRRRRSTRARPAHASIPWQTLAGRGVTPALSLGSRRRPANTYVRHSTNGIGPKHGHAARTSRTYKPSRRAPMAVRDDRQPRKARGLVMLQRAFVLREIDQSFRRFFGTNPLSQLLDETNALAELTHVRRLSSLGVGGVTRETATMAVRSIHPTHYGRICPIETPEGKNAGLVNSLTNYGQLNQNGLIETPLLPTYRGYVIWDKNPRRASSIQESCVAVASGDHGRSPYQFLSRHGVAAKRGSDYASLPRDEVDWVAIHPLQMTSVATGLIPFLEHDDGNRALMGSNMQRQAIGTMHACRPIVGTGGESRAVANAAANVQAKNAGLVVHADADCVLIDVPVKPYRGSDGTGGHDRRHYDARRVGLPTPTPANAERRRMHRARRWDMVALGSTTPAWARSLQRKPTPLTVIQSRFLSPQSVSSHPWRVGVHGPSLPTWPMHRKTPSVDGSQDTPGPSCRAHVRKVSLHAASSATRHDPNFKPTRERYRMMPLSRVNQETYRMHRPRVRPGQWVQRGDLVAENASSCQGELSVGQNLVVGYCPWEGYNFEDAILINRRLATDDLLTSLHVNRYEVEVRDTVYGYEEITRAKLPEGRLHPSWRRLDIDGVVSVGAWVEPGDLLMGRIQPLQKPPAPQDDHSGFERLVQALAMRTITPGLRIRPHRDTSVVLPAHRTGRVVHVEKSRFPRDVLEGAKSDKPNPPRRRRRVTRKSSVKGGRSKGRRTSHRGLAYASQPQGFLRTQNRRHMRQRVASRRARNTAARGFRQFTRLQDRSTHPWPSMTTETLRRTATLEPSTRLRRAARLKVKRTPNRSSVLRGYVRNPTGRSVTPIVNAHLQRRDPWAPWDEKLGRFRWRSLPSVHRVVGRYHRRHGRLTVRRTGRRDGLDRQQSYAVLRLPVPPRVTSSRVNPKSLNYISTSVERNRQEVIRELDRNCTDRVRRLPKRAPAKKSRALKHRRDDVSGSYTRKDGTVIEKPVFRRVVVYVAHMKRVQRGDKLSGRHGNKGIISRLLPRADMPYLPDGTPLDVVLNPLGVPSRMNVGQIFECMLGLAGAHLHQNYRLVPFDEIYGCEASRSLVYAKLYEARLKSRQDWLFDPNFPGKVRLFDGRTGQCFRQPVTVGKAYILKLIHLVDDKVHSRTVGPYSLITQQPLRGRAKNGGQRLGEMEVWALEGFGASHILQEMMTFKSDDMVGRDQLLRSFRPRVPRIVRRHRGRVANWTAHQKNLHRQKDGSVLLLKPVTVPVDGRQIHREFKPLAHAAVPTYNVPESFHVLMSELRGLGLHVDIAYRFTKGPEAPYEDGLGVANTTRRYLRGPLDWRPHSA